MDLSIRLKFLPVLLILGMATLSSCSDGENSDNDSDEETTSVSGHYFIGARTDDGTEYVMQADSINGGVLNIKDNILELPQSDYTWIFRDSTAIGLVYQQQYAGLGYALRLSDASKPFVTLGEFRIETRYSNYGFFNGQLVTSVAGQVSSDGTRNDGATFSFWNITEAGVSLDHTKTIWTEDITGNGQQITFSSIVDNGDGTFMTSMVQSAYNQTGTGNGSSVGDVAYPDSVWVAKMDSGLNILQIYRDDRISYSAGQYRSQVFPEVFRADDGTIYVFSNAFCENTTRNAAALRIKSGADEFDPDYYFDIQTAAEGYKFRRIWHVTGDTFILEIYNDYKPTSITVGHQFAIVNMDEKEFTWVDGLPAKNLITSGSETGGVPVTHNGKIYLPITQYGSDAVIYIIDPETAKATVGATLTGVTEVRSLGYLE